ncbi:hypothetical protein LOCC1_G005186 [Lachnellula occidentalis]|uniref:N-acetyltransferase domain-containing protein n=1 Tax=Lachnellula occidentalis TaxID=215460 RepID=A0A8H8RUC5_9HELO|nr:hypothetical protein LOCC1_G005186 [Lachnellula occidentalis]
MTLELQVIDPETDFPSLARCLFDSHEDPPQRFFHVFFPIHGEGDKAREDAINEGATRLKLWHTQDPASYWQKVVDTKTGRVAGGAMWKIYRENPFQSPSPDEDEVTWFPNGGSRTFVECALEEYSIPRARVAQKPHVYLFVLFTHPEYRRKGVGQQFMDWGMKKADQLGYDFFLESTFYGRPLYEANGFLYIEECIVHPETENPEDDWKKIDEKVGLWTFWLMWRPAGGQSKEGKTIRP